MLRPIPFASWLAALVLVAIAAACVVGELDYTGKTCTTTCPGDLRCIDGACTHLDAAVYVTGFRLDWATPNAIRWTWAFQGKGTDLASYELVLGSDVPNASGTKTWTAKDNAELGGYQLKLSNGFDVVDGTITYDLDPSTTYTAKLVVHDVYGHTFTSPSVWGSTDAPRPERLAIFTNGALAPGAYLLPGAPSFVVAPTGGVTDGPSLDYRPNLDPGSDGGVAQNLRVQGFDLAADSSLTAKLFDAAYLEFWIRARGAPTSVWSNVWLRFAASSEHPCPNPEACGYGYDGKWVVHPDATNPIYRRVQIPLAVLRRRAADGAPLTFADTVRHFDEVNVYFPYIDPATDGATLDRITIHW